MKKDDFEISRIPIHAVRQVVVVATCISTQTLQTLIENEDAPEQRRIGPDDFITWRGACQLTDTRRRAFFNAYEQRRSTVTPRTRCTAAR